MHCLVTETDLLHVFDRRCDCFPQLGLHPVTMILARMYYTSIIDHKEFLEAYGSLMKSPKFNAVASKSNDFGVCNIPLWG